MILYTFCTLLCTASGSGWSQRSAVEWLWYAAYLQPTCQEFRLRSGRLYHTSYFTVFIFNRSYLVQSRLGLCYSVVSVCLSGT